MAIFERAAVELPVPFGTLDPVRDVFRFEGSGGFDRENRVTLIGGGAAPSGPSGFRVTALRVRPATEVQSDPQGSYAVLHVASGSILLIEGAERRRLGPRDTALVGPDTRFTLVSDGAEARVLEIRFAPRGGKRRLDRRIATVGTMTAVRGRFPVRYAPRIHDVLSPRTLYPVVGPVRWGPARYAIVGPDELVVALATTPKGTGPALHVHRYSTEMFVVLDGEFRVRWGETGEHEVTLRPLDAIVVPCGVNRTFQAVGDAENWILPLVVGTNDETEDIVFFREVGDRLREVGPALAAALAMRTRVRIGERAREQT